MKPDKSLVVQAVATALKCTLTSFDVVDTAVSLHLTLADEKTPTPLVFLNTLREGVLNNISFKGNITEKNYFKNCNKCGKGFQCKGRLCIVIELNDAQSKCTECSEEKDQDVCVDQSDNTILKVDEENLINDNECGIEKEDPLISVTEPEAEREGSDNAEHKYSKKDKKQTNEYHCSHCKKSFKTMYTYKKHRKTHTNTKFKCQICMKMFKNYLYLVRHKKVHDHKCKVCGKAYAQPILLDMHMLGHQDVPEKPFSCQQCGKTFAAIAYLRKHLKTRKHASHNKETADKQPSVISKSTRPNVKRRQYRCTVCGENHITQAYLRKHMDDHTYGQRKTCAEKSSGNPKSISKQKKKDTERKVTSIKIEQGLETEKGEASVGHSADGGEVGTLSTDTSQVVEASVLKVELDGGGSDLEEQTRLAEGSRLNNSGSVHQDVGDKWKLSTMEHCNSQKQKSRARTRKQKSQPKKRIEKSQLEENTESDENTERTCKFCNAVFAKKKNYARHCRVVHSVNIADNSFLCHICGKPFTSQENVEKHVKSKCAFSENEKQKCHVCGKMMKNSITLEKHMHQHTADRSYMCELCGKRFLKNASLKSHMFSHADHRPHKCDICEMAFRNVWDMKNHRKTHTGENLFQCPMCKDWFINESYLKNRHQRRYCKALKRCFCNVCGREFLDKKSLQSHMGFHSGERPYMCDKCGKAFAKIPNLDDHCKRHMEEATVQCLHCDRLFKRASDMRKHMKRHFSTNSTHLKKNILRSELKPKGVPQDSIVTEQELDEATMLLGEKSVIENKQVNWADTGMQQFNLEPSVGTSTLTNLSSSHVMTLPSSHMTTSGEEVTMLLPSEGGGYNQNFMIT